MIRKFRLVSLGGLDIGVNGVNGSSLLDTLLLENPHKVATISIPFNDKTVLDFAKNLMNPEKEISRDAAKRIGAVYKLLGINIGVDFEGSAIAESRASRNVEDNADLNKTALENESEETKYIIKIELEQQLSTNHESVENINSNGDISVAIEHTSIDCSENQTYLTSDSHNQDVQNNFVEDDNDSLEPGVDASTNSSDKVLNLTQNNGEEAYDSNDTNEHDHDRPPNTEEVDCYDNCSEADFSFHDLEEDRAQESYDFESNDASNITEMTNAATSTVVRNILITSQSHTHSQIPDSMADGLYSKVPDILRLRFVKTAVFPIRDISRKRKRKRGH